MNNIHFNWFSFIKKNTAVLLLSICVFFVATPGCSASEKPVRLALQWYPQAQFAGYYMAQVKGIYARHGLKVELLPGGADSNSLERLRKGEAEFCTAFLSAAMEMRSRGIPVVNIGQIVQRSALMLIARKKSGIKTIKDLDGKRIGTWSNEFQLQPKALFKREGLNVKLVRQSPSFELFMRGGLDAVMAMWYNEYHRLTSYGLNPEEMTTFFFSDLELNIPEDGIYCLETTLNKSPATAAKLISASTEGWAYAFAHPEETVDTLIGIMKKYNIRANKTHQNWMLERMKNVIIPEGQSRIDTRLSQTDFYRTREALLSTGVIRSSVSYSRFCKEPAQ